MHTVRTTIRPHEEITVDDAEYTDLKAMGLIVGGTEQEEIAAQLAQAEADRAAAAAKTAAQKKGS